MKNKLTKEERADEIISRFYNINETDVMKTDCTDPYISRRAAVLCAIELAKEALYISSNGYSAEWHNRYSYWESILSILESKLL
jgi:hypothetical protein